MRCRESLGDLSTDLDRLPPVHWSAMNALAQRFSFQQLGHDVAGPLVVTEVEDGEDVRVRERGNRSRLALKSRHRVGVARRVLRENFDGHIAAKPRITSAINLPHP